MAMDDFAQRSKMYQARADALDQAKEKLSLINGFHGIFTILTVIVGLVLLWFNPSIHWAIVTLGVLIGIRWTGNIIVRLRFTNREMARIDKEFPTPPPRERNGV